MMIANDFLNKVMLAQSIMVAVGKTIIILRWGGEGSN